MRKICSNKFWLQELFQLPGDCHVTFMYEDKNIISHFLPATTPDLENLKVEGKR